MDWKPIDTAPHNTNILVATKCGHIDVANDGYEPARFIRNARGVEVWHEERYWWSNPHFGGHDAEWDFDEKARDLTHWMPLPEMPQPIIEGQATTTETASSPPPQS